MKMTFRWYGLNDSISLDYIKQIPNMYSVVTALYNIKVGEAWEIEDILALKEIVEKHGLKMEVIESVPVCEDIKLGKPSRDYYINNYIKTIKNLGKCGVKCVCYNFMPVFDWLRTDLKYKHSDNSNSLRYSHDELINQDVTNLHLPGWDESYTTDELNGLLEEYKNVTHEDLFNNLVYFLDRVIPACIEADVKIAIHPDDPPWDMFNLPRIITGSDSYEKLFNRVPSIYNGITFCTGSLGAKRENDLVEIVNKYASRIHFAHIRQITYENELDFYESGHRTDDGSLDIFSIVKSLVVNGFDGYVRPDHGRNIWGEDGKPGYGLYDRALGSQYLNGLFEAIEKMVK